ncbi:hypothetical protein TNCV_1273331 [Trichonephila clavipes]|nr:hypothetical protein TNCV_1273331 [Trichonephila clavipes]
MESSECIGKPLKDIAIAVQCTRNAYKRGAAMKSNTIPNHDTGCRTSVAMHNATVQQSFTTVSSNSNLIIVMLLAEAEFVSKHNAIPFRCQSPSFIAPLAVQKPVVSIQG